MEGAARKDAAPQDRRLSLGLSLPLRLGPRETADGSHSELTVSTGTTSKSGSAPILKCPTQFPLILWHPSARHYYFCMMTEAEQDKWQAVLQDCIRHCNNGEWPSGPPGPLGGSWSGTPGVLAEWWPLVAECGVATLLYELFSFSFWVCQKPW